MSTHSATEQRGNHLLGQRSLYLQQHAHNPIDWYPWCPEALNRARQEDRPIFLSVGYASCHWCHVMEQEVFEQPEAARLLNERFICIKLDREERPDLDAVYMEALQAMTGGGGWPMSLFLTPELKPFFAETFIPLERFLLVARELSRIYQEQRGLVLGQAEALYQRLSADAGPGRAGKEPLSTEALDDIVQQAEAQFDPAWGGLKGQMKFPTPPRWIHLLHHHRRTGDEVTGRMVRATLDAMASGGIHDQLGGGFHRYTVEQTWLIPHFEKMLYDNAQLGALFTEASVALASPRYAEVARATLDFLCGELQGDGGFYASFDADSGGQEGSFYVWDPRQVEAVVGPHSEALCRLLGVTEAGNFEGSSVLTRRVEPAQVAQELGLELKLVEQLLPRHRDALLEARARRVGPTLDRKIITAWNGLAISALARGAAVLEQPAYLAAATRAADYLWRVHRRQDDALYRSSNEGQPDGNEAVLSDYALLAQGLLDLHRASGDAEHVRRALGLLEHARQHFAHPHAGFYQTPERQAAPLGRRVELIDNVRPSGNAAMARALLTAGELCQRDDLRQHALRSLEAHGPWFKRFGLELSAWLDAADAALGAQKVVVVAGEPGEAATEALAQQVRALALPHVSLVLVDRQGPDPQLARLLPCTEGKRAPAGVAAQAHVCRHGACEAPLTTAQQLRDSLASW